MYRFLRDDSKSKFAREDDEENANPEEEEGRRDKARALWRARQKFKDCVQQEDDNSLSRFDLFKDRDDNRSQEIRQRLERAIRPASKRDDEDKGKKRKSPWAQPESTVPEWKRRRACLEEKERKRAHAVSVGRWSFSSHAKKEGKAEKRDQGDGKKVKQTLGASHIVRKNRRREMPAPRKPPSRAGVQTSKPKKGPTTFKGLLSILGQQAKRSDQ